jgi:hypothetical protein
LDQLIHKALISNFNNNNKHQLCRLQLCRSGTSKDLAS